MEIYLIKECAKECFELLSIFMSFLNEIKIQFVPALKIYKNNNAKIYFSSDFLCSFELMEFYINSFVLIHLSKMV